MLAHLHLWFPLPRSIHGCLVEGWYWALASLSDSHGLGLFGFYYCFSCYGLVPGCFSVGILSIEGLDFGLGACCSFFFAKPHVALLLVPTVNVTTSMINEIFCLSKQINKFNSTNYLCGTYFEMSPRQSRISLVYLVL